MDNRFLCAGVGGEKVAITRRALATFFSVLIGLCLVPSIVHAGAFTVSSPHTVQSPELEFEFEHDHEPRTDTYEYPHLSFTAPAGTNVELGVEVWCQKLESAHGASGFGLNGYELKSKWQAYKSRRVSIGVENKLKFAVGDGQQILGRVSEYEPSFMIQYQRFNWQFGSEIGLKHDFQQGLNNAYVALRAMHGVGTVWELGAEIVFESRTTALRQLRSTIRVGIERDFAHGWGLEASVGTPVHTPNHFAPIRTYYFELVKEF